MNGVPEHGRPARAVETEGGAAVVELSDAEGGNQARGEPVRSLAALRLLVRERMKVYGSPLPEGYQLPPGITLEELLKPTPKTGPV
jgi:hypothetical protein